MNAQRQNGKTKVRKSGDKCENCLPEFADLLKGLNDTQKRAVDAIVAKEPSEKWSAVARKVGVSERQLRNIRNEKQVQEACYQVVKQLFRSEIPDVLKVLSRKAISGQAWAVKLFLEMTGEYDPRREGTQVQTYTTEELERKAELSLYDTKNMTPEELTDLLQQRLRLYHEGVGSA